MTVYRHFPDVRTLLEPCSSHAQRLNPPPDLAAWRAFDDARERIGVALAQLYDYAAPDGGGARSSTTGPRWR